MSRDFTHTITMQTTRGSAKLPLRMEVTATFDNDGTMDRWGVAVQGHPQSAKNRDALCRLLRQPVRDTVTGDYVGAQWTGPDTVEMWWGSGSGGLRAGKPHQLPTRSTGRSASSRRR